MDCQGLHLFDLCVDGAILVMAFTSQCGSEILGSPPMETSMLVRNGASFDSQLHTTMWAKTNV